jgi:hypothetical protein
MACGRDLRDISRAYICREVDQEDHSPTFLPEGSGDLMMYNMCRWSDGRFEDELALSRIDGHRLEQPRISSFPKFSLICRLLTRNPCIFSNSE